ncbi:hypothetical protein LTR36_003309 [Oleoguttula mirabilis]|uniref:DUF3844 domain-containing protein n=1 Tax=Oleoguttula mirabilis TaxID=1507867 RepID=A0AAV9JX67_9PEZI|nr:hypothetical protein LTR36_003309 [Oleoguttula mirabilis]
MKLTSTAALATLCWTARLASAATGRVYIIDPSHSQPRRHDADQRSLSPLPARLVLAQRAGVEDYHSADLESVGVMEAINEFGVRTPLFGEQDKRRRAMVLVEGVRDAEADMPLLANHSSFALTPAPDATASRGLWIDLAKQAKPEVYADLDDEEAIDRMSTYTDQTEHNFYIAHDMADFHAFVTSPNVFGKWAITAYITPPPEKDTRIGNGVDQWGTYTMPNAQSPLRKRETQGRPQKEAPLEYTEPPTSADFEAAETAKAVFESFTAPISTYANKNNNSTSTPLAGILPSCFTTLAYCQLRTRNCTGHGTCAKKFTDNSAKDQSRYKDCYSCGCSPTVRTTSSEGRKKTTYWGGPACQKKDVSVEFWLIALFTVGIVFVVMFAIGSVYEMGGLELPSVIGAGVSGPVKR